MGLIYDDPRLAALTLIRRAGHGFWRTWPSPGSGCDALHDLARPIGNNTAELLDAVALEAVEKPR